MKKLNPQLKTRTVSIRNSIPNIALHAIELILGVEGGNTNDLDDYGGKTNFGISDLRDGKEDGLIDINLDGIGDVDPENLTRDQAIVIFYTDYWVANHCHQLPSPIAFIIFDIAVNQSAVFARKTLQHIIGAKPDGIIGQKTLTCLQDADNSYVTFELTKRRCLRYATKVKTNPKQLKYLKGWLDRAFTVLYEANHMTLSDSNE
jgi:lysozyme family protein